jgi:hypothetical protein
VIRGGHSPRWAAEPEEMMMMMIIIIIIMYNNFKENLVVINTYTLKLSILLIKGCLN